MRPGSDPGAGGPDVDRPPNGGWHDGSPDRGRHDGPWASRRSRRYRQGWGRPGHGRTTGFIGCLVLALVLFVAVITALATWLAGTLLGLVSPGSEVSAPTAFVVLALIVVAVIAMGRMLGRAVRPLASIADATGRLADGETGVRVAVAGPGPVRRLAASFNSMADRLDRARTERQAQLADVTHELRTPLQVIAGSVEAMLDGVHPRDDGHLAPILAETVVMGRLLDDLRTLSLAEAGALPLHREETDARRLVEAVIAGHAAAARDAGVTLTGDDGPPIRLDIDPVRIREVLANLVVNALRHTPAGGSVRVAAAVRGSWVELTVADTGEGIRPEDLDRVFERFERRAGEREPGEGPRRVHAGGSGLGLTIARDLVAAHGGTIAAESDGVPGNGTTMRVRLPRS